MSLITIDQVNVSPYRRPLKDHKVAELMQSIRVNGLLNPITLDQNYMLIAGLHRLTACKLLGFEQIPCNIIVCENQGHARLAEIDENLVRNELEVLERSELWLERDQILEQLGLRAKPGDNQYTQREVQSGHETVSPPIKTTLEMAKEVGYSDRTFQQGKQIARDIVPEVKQALKDTPVAKSPRSLLKVARAGSKARQQAEQAEQAVRIAKAKQQQAELEQQARRAAEARAQQKELQMIAFQSLAAEKKTQRSPRSNASASVKPSLELVAPDTQPGDEWLLDRHLIYCGSTTGQTFVDLLPSNAALAIANIAIPWQHDYLIEEAMAVAVICPENFVHDFCRSHQMPFQYEVLLNGFYLAVCSHQKLLKPEHLIEVEGIEGIVSYLINLYTQPNHFVIAPALGHGEVLIACERMGRTCFVGESSPDRVDQAIMRWQKLTGKLAKKNV
jgi:ParB family transcriptional regulator, chromosome partitioning protein